MDETERAIAPADHTAVLTEAIAQIPARHRRNLLIRVDGAGFSHELVDWFTALDTAKTHGRRGLSVEYSVGFAVTEPLATSRARQPKHVSTRAPPTSAPNVLGEREVQPIRTEA